MKDFDMSEPRSIDHPVMSEFSDRWSPRALTGGEMPDADMLSILEAARWTPSAFNVQPWCMWYAKREDAAWQQFMDFLVPANASWANAASALVLIGSKTTSVGSDGKERPNGTHIFDTGAAWMSMAIQATHMGYVTHAMAGVLFDKAREALDIPEDIALHAAVAIGHLADPSVLPEPLQAREAPAPRKPISEFAQRVK